MFLFILLFVVFLIYNLEYDASRQKSLIFLIKFEVLEENLTFIFSVYSYIFLLLYDFSFLMRFFIFYFSLSDIFYFYAFY